MSRAKKFLEKSVPSKVIKAHSGAKVGDSVTIEINGRVRNVFKGSKSLGLYDTGISSESKTYKSRYSPAP